MQILDASWCFCLYFSVLIASLVLVSCARECEHRWISLYEGAHSFFNHGLDAVFKRGSFNVHGAMNVFEFTIEGFYCFLEIIASVEQWMLQGDCLILCSMNRVCDDLFDVLVSWCLLPLLMVYFHGTNLVPYIFGGSFVSIVIYMTKLCLLYTLADQSIRAVVLPSNIDVSDSRIIQLI